MSALLAERSTVERETRLLVVPVKANTIVLAGALVVSALGFAVGGSSAANLVALGRAEETVNNNGGLDGAKTVVVKRGTFKFENDVVDAVTQVELGKRVFIKDDQTVKKTGGAGFSEAGRVIEVESDGVWIEVGA